MKTNNYHALCSNEILKMLSSLVNDDVNLSSLRDRYNSLFENFKSVNVLWPLVSTSLLMSENLYKYDKSYRLISDDTMKLITDKLYMYPVVQLDEHTVSPCLLDENNHISSCFLSYIKCDFFQEDYCNNDSSGKYFFVEDLKHDKLVDDLKETLENLRSKSSYGCNDSIIEDGFINIRKFIEKTRNALAHSNYEVIDTNHIRLYHYNTNTKKLDFNVILEPSIIVLIVDELNEIANRKYEYFMNFYHNPSDSELFESKITDERIIRYMLSFEMFDEEVALSILNELKTKPEFVNAPTEDDKVIAINETIYERIRPTYDVGIILNNYLYCDENGKILSDELYDKYGVFDYLNSDYYDTADSEVNDKVYIQNKFQFLLLALLNCSLLNSYNITEGKDIGIIDFSKMNIDEDIMRKFLEKNGVKARQAIDIMEHEIARNKKAVEEKTIVMNKQKDILMNNYIDNDYYNNVLPLHIQELEVELLNITTSNICTVLELARAKEQGSMYNFDKNISQFVFNHLRNSLAHGYVKFSQNINLSNVSDMNITFEDYNPSDKKELTFRGSIKLGDLLNAITSDEYVNNVLGIPMDKKSGSLVKK